MTFPEHITIPGDVFSPEALNDWADWPATLDLGQLRARRTDSAIHVNWPTKGRDVLRALPTYEEGDRFARLVILFWDGTRLVEGHAEHMHTVTGGVDESKGTVLHSWAEEGYTLAQTIAEKSKDQRTIDRGIHFDKYTPCGLAVATHDQNPHHQRTPWFFFGASPVVVDQRLPTTGPPAPPPVAPDDKCAAHAAAIEQLHARFAADLNALLGRMRNG